MSPEDGVTQRDVYELAQRIDEKIDRVERETNSRFQKVYYALTAIIVMVGSPKVGGPSVPHIVESVQRWFS